MYKLATLLVVAALESTAQIPMSGPIGECSTIDAVEDDGNDNVALSKFVIPPDIVIGFSPGTLCSFYATAGWESPLKLHLGEGADEYRDLIERAVEVWNETVKLPSREPLIEIIETRPTNYLLQSSFWSNTSEYGHENLEDDESVIYFKPSGEDETSLWGLAWLQRSWSRSSMIEADVYINTADEESLPGSTLILTKKLVDVDSLYGAYALYNKTYSVILHELGHAVGLNHIPVSGNIMSRDFGGGGIDQWAAAIALELFNDLSPRLNKFVYLHSQIHPYTSISEQVHEKSFKGMEFFTENAKLGEQEKMALTCIYQY